jgi:hypothetical protein
VGAKRENRKTRISQGKRDIKPNIRNIIGRWFLVDFALQRLVRVAVTQADR